MAFSDWEFATDGIHTESLAVTDVINGSSSLSLVVANGNGFGWNAKVTVASGIARLITYGKIRTLIKIVSSTSSGHFPGIFCMATSTAVTAGSLYFLRLNEFTSEVELAYSDSGLDDTAMDILDSDSSIAITTGGTYAIELEWRQDFDELGGTLLTYRTGTAINYSDLTERGSVIDVNIPGATLGEGLGHLNANGSFGAEYRFDDTTIFTIA